MRITIEDLEALKELSDELEENHIETEKQLYDDIGIAKLCLIFSSFTSFHVRATRNANTGTPAEGRFSRGIMPRL